MGMVREIIMGQPLVEALYYIDASTICKRACMFPSSSTSTRFSCSSSSAALTPNGMMMKKQRSTTAVVAPPTMVPTTPVGNKRSTSTIDEDDDNDVKVKISACVTLKSNNKEEMMAMMLQCLDHFNNNTLSSTTREETTSMLIMQLVSTQIDPSTMEAKVSKEAVLDWSKESEIIDNEGSSTYKVEFEIDSNFGLPGAVTVTNTSDKEIFLECISIESFFHISSYSWIQPQMLHPHKRIFFTNKAYVPCNTPEGLKELRKEELRQVRGDGEGTRKIGDRVYDYDVYNDLGPQTPILGTKQFPNPRRCRTGRPPATFGEGYESLVKSFMETYVPRDEAFDRARKEALDVERVKGITRNLIPYFRTCIIKCGPFKQLSDVRDIYKRRRDHVCEVDATNKTTQQSLPIPMDFNKFQGSFEDYFKFSSPHIISGNGCCIRDEELGRQALAGVNPLSIKRLQTFPPVSDLDQSIYGAQESALKEEHIVSHLDGMSVQQAMDAKKLFILDYHDAYLPYLKGINGNEDRKAYATRTILYLTRKGTLKPIAIELSLPEAQDQENQSKQVLNPPVDATSYWFWQLAKAHVCSNDAGLHQLVHHWLRTHACMEPFIIATHRQLSAVHPIFKLLKPHLKCTLHVNAMAREALINGGGIIESDFSTGKYSTEIISAAYKDWWRFDMEALPADLIRRGLAEPDSTKPHGLKLMIEDYPYANDGLLIWFALERMVRTYVNYYYHDGLMVRSDNELQAWYSEIINVGHGDHADASWWPTLSTTSDLTSILTTLIWIASVQHSAVNFGQYPLGGYVPMRPPHMKKLLPKEEDPEYKEFMEDPEGYLLSAMPNLFETTKFLAVLNILSQHSSDEEYIGQRRDLSDWAGDPEIIEAFYKFSIDLKGIEKVIDKRNKDQNLRNRCGAGIPPYELLMPSSGPGITCRGVPNSIST